MMPFPNSMRVGHHGIDVVWLRTSCLWPIPLLGQRGICAMDSLSADRESGVESELIDLGAVSLTVLRELDGTVFRQALRHVMQQTAHQRVTTGGSRERLD